MGSNSKEPRNTIFYLIANYGEKLVSEEMSFSTQMDQDDFKATVSNLLDK